MSSIDDTMNGVAAEVTLTPNEPVQQEPVNMQDPKPVQPVQDSAMGIVTNVNMIENTELLDPDTEGMTEVAQVNVVEKTQVELVNVAETASSVAPGNPAIPQDLEMIMNMVVDGGESENVAGMAGTSRDTQLLDTAEVESDR